ncbi:chitinase [Actinoplanes sp. SE50]|uniref:ricin-type beta-trefoil lectin domain protein n=1 Tax=unclassified Actinoplanes TaxID=2626549 RepID=UPI00023EBE94|nr:MULTISPECIES: ricin-type beta-trefoil lectin domain protein [unclassified Actinoplanes]AEV82374.1 cellulose-binding family II [Actinoplanes sp. SE50/110]ATO80771.1 chitinase [Actinoplanes sp. SE50]SLL98179.1 chitinase [Actinoplanes sp. SE50/110]
MPLKRTPLLAVGTAALVAGTLGVLGITDASAASAGTLASALNGKCLDVTDGSTANGTLPQLWDCVAGSANQLWTLADNGSVQGRGKCLDVANNATTDGAAVHLWDCFDSVTSQKWTLNAAGDLVNKASGKCLDVRDRNTANGAKLQLWTCTGTSNQKWTFGGGSVPTTPPATGGPGAKAVAPYYYTGWGNPPSLSAVTAATGVRWFTMAFMLNSGTCDPKWDGSRPLTGGQDQTAITTIRADGGDVIVSFGGASGPWLEHYCGSASALAAAYQKVIDAYGLKAIDIDIEGTPYDSATDQQKTVDALKTIKANNPGITTYITLGSGTGGPDDSLIKRAAAAGLVVDGWGIMTFDWGNTGGNQGQLTIQAADGLKNKLKSAYGWSDAEAYHHVGISSMNGITDEHATVTLADMQTITAYAQQHTIARLTFWSLNRDRQCPGAYPNDDTCSGVAQSAYQFTKIIGAYRG